MPSPMNGSHWNPVMSGNDPHHYPSLCILHIRTPQLVPLGIGKGGEDKSKKKKKKKGEAGDGDPHELSTN